MKLKIILSSDGTRVIGFKRNAPRDQIFGALALQGLPGVPEVEVTVEREPSKTPPEVRPDIKGETRAMLEILSDVLG